VTFLPIVERELRVAARKRSTFWLRVVAALVALIIGGACLMLAKAGGFRMVNVGPVLFGILTWMAIAAALSSGLFFTSDCLSEEKREGTLGLLFLTDLHGYDVVAGKLLATSLRCFYALLALLPILAVTLLMGGVTGAHFWKAALGLLNALLCSLVVGLVVSAISRDSQKALAGTLFALLLLTFGGPLADATIAGVKKQGFIPLLSLSSPGYVFSMAGAWGRNGYWFGLLITQAIAWFLFGLTCLLIPRAWQEKANTAAVASRTWAYAWKYGGPRRRAKVRRKLLDRDAVLWLACRERWQSLAIWGFAVLAAGGFALGVAKMPGEAWMVWSYLGGFFRLVLYLWAASQACRFFVEARKSGLIELLLASPVPEIRIVRAQWRALLMMFGAPVLLLLCINMAGAGFSQNAWRRMYAGAAAATVTTTTSGTNSVTTTNFGAATTTYVFTTTAGSNSATLNPPSTAASGTNSPAQNFVAQMQAHAPGMGTVLVAAGMAGVAAAANFIALCWFGMWMGLTSRTANLATLKTLLFVQVIPALVIWFASMMGIWALMIPIFLKKSAGAPTWMFSWWPLVSAALMALLSLAKDIVFFVWSRKKLYFSFREQAAQSIGQPRLITLPPVLAPVSLPPIIAAES
jgi:ABC-type transport system involved in cytochrome c biogenesis permease component